MSDMERMLRGAYKNYLYNHTCEDAAQTYMIARQNTPSLHILVVFTSMLNTNGNSNVTGTLQIMIMFRTSMVS